jgi:hypothetical protein
MELLDPTIHLLWTGPCSKHRSSALTVRSQKLRIARTTQTYTGHEVDCHFHIDAANIY